MLYLKLFPKKSFYTQVYTGCLMNCSIGDVQCITHCGAEYEQNRSTCPCQSGCPDGCPCPNYECPTTTTTTTTIQTTTTAASPKTNILILNTVNTQNVPIITNRYGLEDRNFYFMYGDETEVHGSCGITRRNQQFIFGGISKKTQISRINGCKLENFGQLNFNFLSGACANVANSKIYLCFHNQSTDYKKCRVASSPTSQFETIAESIDEHDTTRIAANECKTKIAHRYVIF